MADAHDPGQFEAHARAARRFAEAAGRLSDDELRVRTMALRRRAAGAERFDAVLPEALASVREAARRAVAAPYRDADLASGVAVHAGRVVETKAAEDNAPAAIVAAYLHALAGQGVHLVTVDDQVARRGAGPAAAVLGSLGLRVAAIGDGSSHAERAQAYTADVTYGAYRRFVYDYLRDNLAWQPEERMQRSPHAVVLDDIGAILIDQGGEPLVLTGRVEPDVGQYRRLAELAALLGSGRYFAIDEATGAVTLTRAGTAQAEDFLGMDGLLRPEHAGLAGSLADAICAREWYREGRDYVVAGGEVVAADDRRTGRLRRTTRFDRGIRQAIEAGHGLHISPEQPVLARISVAGYLRLYRSIGGLTAAAVPASGLLSRGTGHRRRDLETQAARMLRAASGYQAMDDDQCAQAYQMRNAILGARDLHARACQLIGEAIEASVAANPDPRRLRDALAALYPVGLSAADLAVADGGPAATHRVTARAKADALAAYQRREQELGSPVLRELEKRLMLGVIDREWREYLLELDRLHELAWADDGADGDPSLDSYRGSAPKRYGDFLSRVRWRIVSNLFFLEIPRKAFRE